ncbi:nitric oxide-associated protein 1 [Porphyrio hochstetteri]
MVAAGRGEDGGEEQKRRRGGQRSRGQRSGREARGGKSGRRRAQPRTGRTAPAHTQGRAGRLRAPAHTHTPPPPGRACAVPDPPAPAMRRLGPALLGRLGRLGRAPHRAPHRAPPPAEQEPLVFLEYEPEPSRDAAGAAPPRREPARQRRQRLPVAPGRPEQLPVAPEQLPVAPEQLLAAPGRPEQLPVAPEQLPVAPEQLLAAPGRPEQLPVAPEQLPVAPGRPNRLPVALGRRPDRFPVAPGRPDPSVPPSGISCSGCGAELQCRDAAAPGFVPSEKYRSVWEGPSAAAGLRATVCQRCWLLSHYGRALRLELPAEQHRLVVSAALRRPPRHGRGPLLLYVLDVLELPDPLLPQLPALLSPDVPAGGLLVVGNKVDLLPADSPGYLKRLRERVAAACAQAGLRGAPLVGVRLVSAKTGFGLEGLVSRLQRSWRCAGDVYLLGATNSGKSTLFNALLRSDYCKSRAPHVVDRATVSSWPGTTLNLLKFPIINPTCDRIFRRQERLKEEALKTEDQLSREEQKYLNHLKKQGYLVGRVGRTFQQPKARAVVDFDPDELSYSVDEDPKHSPGKAEQRQEFTHNEVKDARWCFDTPGIMKENCVLNLLTEGEVKLVLPTQAIVPRTFILQPGMVLFLAALGRIDYLEGSQSAWFSVVASNRLPVHVAPASAADAIYQKQAGRDFLKVPMGGEERMKEFPPLVPQDIRLQGVGPTQAVADIKLSSAGWVAVTAPEEEKLLLRAYTPRGTRVVVRDPLLPFISSVRGRRIPGTAAYRTRKPPALVENLRAAGRR